MLRKTEFNAAFAGSRRHSDWFSAFVTPASHGSARLGLAIGRKAARKANARNLLKRLAREHFRAEIAALPIVDIVITAKSGAAAQPRALLHTDLAKLFARILALKLGPPNGTISA